jgi:cyclopropane-fatty-acyl-phospholipid synthase
MDGGLTFEEGSTVDDYVKLYAANRAELKQQPAQRVLQQLWRWTRHFQQRNTIAAGVRQARGHYASEELFQLFLDSGMHYSSAYWTDPTTETLEDAQRRKMRHFAAKLELKKGMRVLDIGSGWGAFSIYLSKHFDVKVTAANPAKEQLAASRRRAEQAGVADRITFLEKDYRELDGSFDRIVSIEMLEHVGAGYLDTYFRKARELLASDGRALVTAGGRMSPPGVTGPFVRKYIFPGGSYPSLSEVIAAIERAQLWVCDLEIWRLQYLWTVREWLRRFRANRGAAIALYDERFYRMWEFYLVAAEEYFRTGDSMVFQLLLSADGQAVPVSRDYMVYAERALTAAGEHAHA